MRLIICIFIILYLNICNMFITLNYKLLVIRLLYFNDLGPIRILIMYSMICKLYCDIIFLHNHIYHSSHVCNHVSFSARTFLLLNIFMHSYKVLAVRSLNALFMLYVWYLPWCSSQACLEDVSTGEDTRADVET